MTQQRKLRTAVLPARVERRMTSQHDRSDVTLDQHPLSRTASATSADAHGPSCCVAFSALRLGAGASFTPLCHRWCRCRVATAHHKQRQPQWGKIKGPRVQDPERTSSRRGQRNAHDHLPQVQTMISERPWIVTTTRWDTAGATEHGIHASSRFSQERDNSGQS